MQTLNVEVLTLFPSLIEGPLNESILKRGREKGILNVRVWNIRDFAEDKHKKADDTPYGGGAGMVLKPEPIFRAVEAVRAASPGEETLTILLSPQGRLFTQREAERLSREQRRILLICGHYEAVDERVREALVDEELVGGDSYLLIPGLINGHGHGKGLTDFQRGSLDDTLESWILGNRKFLPLPVYEDVALCAAQAPEVGGHGNHAQP